MWLCHWPPELLGLATEQVDSRIVDPETAAELATGEVGELVTHAPQLLLRHWDAGLQPRANDGAFLQIDGKRCVIAARDARRGEAVKAIVVRKQGEAPTEAGLIAWAREAMASYKAPQAVEFRGALPRLGTGKTAWRLLQDEQRLADARSTPGDPVAGSATTSP